MHTHSLRHQFASDALDANPRELANISQVLGHDSIETTLHFYIHASANAEQRISAMMNARWASQLKSGLAAAGAGRDEQVRFLVLQARYPLPAACEGGQVDLVGGQVVSVEPGRAAGPVTW